MHCKKSPFAEKPLLVASLLLLSSASAFSEINPRPQCLPHVKSSLWKGPPTAKIRKKFINLILGYISFYLEIRAV